MSVLWRGVVHAIVRDCQKGWKRGFAWKKWQKHTISTPCIHSSTVTLFSRAKSCKCRIKLDITVRSRGLHFGPVAAITLSVKVRSYSFCSRAPQGLDTGDAGRLVGVMPLFDGVGREMEVKTDRCSARVER